MITKLSIELNAVIYTADIQFKLSLPFFLSLEPVKQATTRENVLVQCIQIGICHFNNFLNSPNEEYCFILFSILMQCHRFKPLSDISWNIMNNNFNELVSFQVNIDINDGISENHKVLGQPGYTIYKKFVSQIYLRNWSHWRFSKPWNIWTVSMTLTMSHREL